MQLCWHLLPIWHRPLALWTSQHASFPTGSEIQKIVTSNQQWMLGLLFSSGGSDHTTIVPSSQRSWDDVWCRSVTNDSLKNSTNDTDRARLLASRSDSGDWLNAVALQAVGLKLDNEAVRIAIGLRLGAPLGPPAHMCLWCGSFSRCSSWLSMPKKCRSSFSTQSYQRHLATSLQQCRCPLDS